MTPRDTTPTPRTLAYWNSGGRNSGLNDDCAPNASDMFDFASTLECELIAKNSTIDSLLHHLNQALNQWENYADNNRFDHPSIADSKDLEATLFRDAKAFLQQAKDQRMDDELREKGILA